MIQLTEAGKRFGPKILFQDLNWLITPKERVGIVGANGTGKSTLLKNLALRWTEDIGEIPDIEVLRSKGESFLEILPPRKSRRQKCEGKREQRMAEADHLQNVPQSSQHENYERH